MGHAIFQQCCSHYYTVTKTADADSDKPLCISTIILMDFIALWCLYAGDSFLLMYSLLSKKNAIGKLKNVHLRGGFFVKKGALRTLDSNFGVIVGICVKEDHLHLAIYFQLRLP